MSNFIDLIGFSNLNSLIIKIEPNKNESHLMGVLTSLKKEFDFTGFLSCNSIGIEKYSRKTQAKKLANIIDKLNF